MRKFYGLYICLGLLAAPAQANAQRAAQVLRSAQNGVRVQAQLPPTQALCNARACTQIAGVRVVQGKILPNKPHTGHVYRNDQLREQMRGKIMRQVHSTQWDKIPFVRGWRTQTLSKAAAQLYQETLEDFEALRHDLNPTLYYQLEPGEPLAPQQKREILEKLTGFHERLQRLSAYILPSDPALKNMLDYINMARRVLVPEAAEMPLTKPEPRTDRIFEPEVFFLHNPKLNFLQRFRNWGKPTSHSFFKDLKVVVLNDREAATAAAWEMHRAGRFLPGSRLRTYTDARRMIADFQRGTVTANFVLTDLALKGSSGYLVVDELRRAGYRGPIVALSAYEEGDSVGLEMFTYGLDGLISEPEGFEINPNWPEQVNKKIENYFYYKTLYGWDH